MLGRVLAGIWRSVFSPAPAPAVEPANPLAAYFFNNPGRLMQKWHHYFDIYHRYFAPFRGRSPVVVEIGVFHGGSLQMWREYFGPDALIVGIDVDPRCRELAGEGIDIMIGDQADRGFLAEVRRRYPRIDILIDDGGHTFVQQIATFEELYPHIQPHGIYLCEDIHTSVAPNFGGGYRREGTFLEYAKGLIDRLYAWYTFEPERFAIDDLTRSTYALHFYDSVLVVQKRPMREPVQSVTGRPSWPSELRAGPPGASDQVRASPSPSNLR